MPGSLVDVATFAAVIAVVLLPAARALALLVVLTLLVPPSLIVPHTHTTYLTFQHVVSLAALARVVAMWTRRPRKQRPPITPVHIALGGLIIVSFVIGVVVSAAGAGSIGQAGYRLADLADLAVFFIACLELLREAGDVRVAGAAVGVALFVVGGIAVGEHASGWSFGHWLFSRLPDQAQTDAASQLQPRAGTVRVRAGTEFALQFGWIVAMLLPILLVWLLQARRRLLIPATGLFVLVLLALYWSYTRSAFAAVVPALMLLALVARDRRVTTLVLVALAIGVFVYAIDPSLGSRYNAQADEGSITVRFQRFAPILQVVAHHPLRGLGLGQLRTSGFGTTDNAFLLSYVELGALGVVALAVFCVVALVQAARPLALADPRDRAFAAAAAVSVVMFVLSAVFYDAFTLLQGARMLMFGVAMATFAGEKHGAFIRMPRPTWRPLAGAVAVGAAIGGTAYALAPVHFAVPTVFTTLPLTRETVSYDPVTAGTKLIDTTCGIVKLQSDELAGATLDCRDLFSAAGMGAIRFEGGSREEVRTAVRAVDVAVRQQAGITNYVDYATDQIESGRPTVWATAPVWAPLGAISLVLVVPWRRLRREPARRPPAHAP